MQEDDPNMKLKLRYKGYLKDVFLPHMIKQDHLDYITKIDPLREKSKQLNDVIKYYQSQDLETQGFKND